MAEVDESSKPLVRIILFISYFPSPERAAFKREGVWLQLGVSRLVYGGLKCTLFKIRGSVCNYMLSDVSISEDIPVEGEITVPVGSPSHDDEYSTLDEPVKETILRDLKAVGKKFGHVMYPKKSTTLLRDWDLWGPLLLCVTLALMLQGGSADSKEDGGPQFAEVFVIIWFGSVIITLNSKLLGGTMLVLLGGTGTASFIVRFIVVVASFGWSSFASTAFLADSQPPNRKALVVYPVFLFYFVISWMILTFSPSHSDGATDTGP
ncbi:UNVERIFIED_CONTAM: hypothetical protein FKN15_027246 [Acipenser sinensis]